MPKHFISNTHDSVRMFRSSWMEALSKVHFSVPLFLYLPVIGYFLITSIYQLHVRWTIILPFYLLGIAVWTLTEYLLHRFVFHLMPKGKRWERIHFIFHGVHHDYPNDNLRLVMPPSVSIPLAFLFYFLFGTVLNQQQLYAFFPGFVSGYLAYDMCHYAVHHYNFKTKFWKELKRHHMLHHYQDQNRRYGVTSAVWDKVFGSQ